MRKTLILFGFFFSLGIVFAFPIQAVTIEQIPLLTGTITSTPTPNQVEITPTPTPMVEIQEGETVLATPTPETGAGTSSGIQFKELIIIGVICLLVLIIILQVYLGGQKPEKPQDSTPE